MTDALIEFIKQKFYALDFEIQKAVSALKLDFLNSGTDDWLQFIQTVIGIIKPIALIIVSICFLVEFLKITIKFDILKWEFLLKVFFKLVFAKVCIDISFDLLLAIYQTACEWITSISGSIPDVGTETWNHVKDTVEDYGFWDALGVVVTSGIMYIGLNLCSLIIRIIAYARMVELVIYMAISPLPCAFLPLEEGGGSRIPKHFVLSFASVCLSGVIMVMSVYLYSLVATTLIDNGLTDPTSAIGELLIATIVLVICMSKSSSIAKSTFDVIG